MPRTKTKIKARIHATVDIFVDTWAGGTCDTDALFEQVRRDGKRKLESLLNGKGVVIGKPSVQLIIIEEGEKDEVVRQVGTVGVGTVSGS